MKKIILIAVLAITLVGCLKSPLISTEQQPTFIQIEAVYKDSTTDLSQILLVK